jgi:hypothetical protein
VPQVDPDQLAALRRLRAAFGPIEVLEVIAHSDYQEQADASPTSHSDLGSSGVSLTLSTHGMSPSV